MTARVLCLILLSALPASAQVKMPSHKAKTISSKVLESYSKMPLAFEANDGQSDRQVKFVSRGAGYNLFLTSNEAIFSLQNPGQERAAHGLPLREKGATVVGMKLVGASTKADVAGQEELAGKSNYFVGSDPNRWHANVRQYAKVRYAGVYPGVDLVYYGHRGQVEYDFVVAPGSDPERIKFDIRGAKEIRSDVQGDLALRSGDREIRWHKPVVYQENGGRKTFVAARYTIANNRRVGFEIGRYDASRPLYIDPLIYALDVGGRKFDEGDEVTVDSAGNAYIVGYTESKDFPTLNAEQAKYNGGLDAFIVKISPAGSVVYSTFLGGTGEETGESTAVDTDGNVYVTGFTNSTNFPTKNPLQAALAGQFDIFVTKLDPTGSSLVYSTYLGGTQQDQSPSITVNGAGSAFVTGQTWSADFPTTPGAFQTTCKASVTGCVDAFIAKINPSGSALVYSTFLGGTSTDFPSGIAIDGADNVYVTGYTQSTDFPTKNPLQPDLRGFNNAFVSKLNTAGTALVYSTYLGGTKSDIGNDIAVDSAGNAYVTGLAQSSDFPTMNPLQADLRGDANAFVSKINPAGAALVYSSYLGGSIADAGYSIAVDNSGNAYVAGYTTSPDFPAECSLQSYGHLADAFVTKINPAGSALVYSTYLGGSKDDWAQGIALDIAGNAYVVGVTLSTNFPGVPQFSYRGKSDAFVAKINISPELTTTALLSSVNPSVLGKAVTFTATVSSPAGGPPTGTVSFRNGTTLLSTRTLNSGVAIFTTSKLPAGMNIITAAYGSDPNFSSSTSTPVNQLVLAASTTTLTSAPNPSTAGQAVTFTATVGSSIGAPPDGEMVSFMKGKTVLGTGPLSGGTAQFVTSTLHTGTSSIKAVYSGDSNIAGSTSNVVKQVVTN